MNFRRFGAFTFCFLFAFAARAHDPGLSTLKIQHIDQQIHATLLFAENDINAVVPLDQNSDGAISKDELAGGEQILNRLAANLLEVSLDENPLPIVEFAVSQHTNNNIRIEMVFAPSPGTFLKVTSKWLDALPPGHRQFVSFQEGTNAARTEDLLDAVNNTFTTELSPSLAKQETTPPKQFSFSQFFVLGVHHIWTGYDHLLFLFGLLIVCNSFKSIAKIITCFTLAHSLTLALATLDIVDIPSRIIEPTIAASIVYVGLENIFQRGQPKGRWLLTFAFGLVHGFGFASVLREMQIAKAGSVVVPLVSFNLGVEVGQIAVAAVILPIFWYLRKKPQFTLRWIPACSVLVAAAGVFWFIQRVWF